MILKNIKSAIFFVFLIGSGLLLTAVPSDASKAETVVTINTELSFESMPFASIDTHRIKGSLYELKGEKLVLISEIEMVYTGFADYAFYPFDFKVNTDVLRQKGKKFYLGAILFRIKDKMTVYSGNAANLTNLESLDIVKIVLKPSSISSINVEKQQEDMMKSTARAKIWRFYANRNWINPDPYNRLDSPKIGDHWESEVTFDYFNSDSLTVSVDYQRCISPDPDNQVREKLIEKMEGCKWVQCSDEWGVPWSLRGEQNSHQYEGRLLKSKSVETPNKNGRLEVTLEGIKKSCWCALQAQTAHVKGRETCAHIYVKDKSKILHSVYYCFDRKKCDPYDIKPQSSRTYINYK